MVRDIWQTTSIKRGGNYGLATVPIQLTADGVKKSIDDALWKKGLRVTPAKQHEFKVCHGLRKYFKTYAQRTMTESRVEQLMGHTGGWSNEAYNRPPDDWLIEDYLKAVPDLTIYKQTQNQVIAEQTQTLMTQMESKDQDIAELREQMNNMLKDFRSYDKLAQEERKRQSQVIMNLESRWERICNNWSISLPMVTYSRQSRHKLCLYIISFDK